MQPMNFLHDCMKLQPIIIWDYDEQVMRQIYNLVL